MFKASHFWLTPNCTEFFCRQEESQTEGNTGVSFDCNLKIIVYRVTLTSTKLNRISGNFDQHNHCWYSLLLSKIKLVFNLLPIIIIAY